MKKLLVVVAVLICSSFAFGAQNSMAEKVTPALVHMGSRAFSNFATFTVGDTLNFNLTVASYGISGTMVMKVTAVDTTVPSVTIEEDANLQIETETIVEVINSKTGAIISVTVNGQAQTPPAPMTVVSQTPTTITVPAGTFACIDLVEQDSSGNKDESWIDTKDKFPIEGLLKDVSTQQGTTIELDLTSFSFGS